MNEFTIFNGTIWFSDADSVYKHLYPEHGFEVESLGVSDRFVSEDAFIAQRNLKDEYMRRDQKHSETISELRKQLEEKQDYIKTLEEHNENQKKEITNLLKKQKKLKAEIVTKSNIIFSRNATCNMLNAKIMELNQGIHDSADLTWKEKYDELEEKWRKKYRELNERYISDSAALNAVINDVRGRLKLREDKIEALETGIKELSDANDDLKKKIRAIEYNDIGYLKRRCTKAEHTIDAIKEALIDGDYIRGIEQLSRRRNDK